SNEYRKFSRCTFHCLRYFRINCFCTCAESWERCLSWWVNDVSPHSPNYYCRKSRSLTCDSKPFKRSFFWHRCNKIANDSTSHFTSCTPEHFDRSHFSVITCDW